MHRRLALLAGAIVLVTPLASSTQTTTPAWSIRADVAESCSCAVSCPCNFGNPTQEACHGTRLIEIKNGHYGGVDLSGVSFAVTFRMGQWARIYVSDAITQGQMKAFESVLPAAFGGFYKTMRSLQRAPLSVERAGDAVRYSVPESTVIIERMRGLNGRPITIDGLPSPAFIGYTQYRSTTHSHKSVEAEFSHSGTNGFTSRMEAESR